MYVKVKLNGDWIAATSNVKNWPVPAYFYFRQFYKKLAVNCSIKVSDDWIRTRVLWHGRRLRCQLCHNNFNILAFNSKTCLVRETPILASLNQPIAAPTGSLMIKKVTTRLKGIGLVCGNFKIVRSCAINLPMLVNWIEKLWDIYFEKL